MFYVTSSRPARVASVFVEGGEGVKVHNIFIRHKDPPILLYPPSTVIKFYFSKEKNSPQCIYWGAGDG